MAIQKKSLITKLKTSKKGITADSSTNQSTPGVSAAVVSRERLAARRKK